MTSSFEKRIKRHISGRLHEFFIITAPAFERLCCQELAATPQFTGAAQEAAGGVMFQGKLFDGYMANLYSRTATRVLIRIGAVSAGSFSRMRKKLAEIPWELYLPSGAALQFHITTHHCRLYHKDAISDILEDSIRGREFPPVSDDSTKNADGILQRILVRGVDDRFQISVDSSGELLHKRGIKTMGGLAPLRETLAAGILMLAGYTGREPLLNPLCGSGTFAVEAALMGQNIPPGWFRSFAFMNWPGFSPNQWRHIRNEAERNFRPDPSLIFASDQSRTACQSLQALTAAHETLRGIQVVRSDFFDLNPFNMTRQAGLVVINPPYGKRMGSRGESRAMIHDIMRKLKSDYRGWRFAMIVPDRSDIRRVLPGWEFHPICHGGLTLEILIGTLSG